MQSLRGENAEGIDQLEDRRRTRERDLHIRIVVEQFTGSLAIVVHEDDVLVDGHHHPAVAERSLDIRTAQLLFWGYSEIFIKRRFEGILRELHCITHVFRTRNTPFVQ